MSKLSAEEMRGVLGADGPTRYAHFVKRVADWEEVWGLRAPDGWVAVSDESGVSMFPVWPHEEYARLVATDDWSNAVPTSIDVHDWIDSWLPNLLEDGSKIAVFPTPQGKGVVVEPQQLKADIENELSRYE